VRLCTSARNYKASTAHMHLWQDDSEVYCLLAHF